jgi:ribosomal protein L32
MHRVMKIILTIVTPYYGLKRVTAALLISDVELQSYSTGVRYRNLRPEYFRWEVSSVATDASCFKTKKDDRICKVCGGASQSVCAYAGPVPSNRPLPQPFHIHYRNTLRSGWMLRTLHLSQGHYIPDHRVSKPLVKTVAQTHFSLFYHFVLHLTFKTISSSDDDVNC